MIQTKRWCDVCKFMTYGNCHPVKEFRAPDDVVLEKRFGLTLLSFSADVAGGTYCNIEVHPQLAGKPLHLGVDPTIASDFRILDLRIGVCSEFGAYNPNGVSAACFQPQPERDQPRNNLFGIDVFLPGHIIVLSVLNTSNFHRHFSALMHAQTIRSRIESPSPSLANPEIIGLSNLKI